VLRNTGNLALAKKLLGHANLRYAHATEDDLRAALGARSDSSPRNSPEPPKEATATDDASD
jgi:hypothetical protein